MLYRPLNYEDMSYDEYYAERQFQIDFAKFMSKRMYPPSDTSRMSRAEFIRYKFKQMLNPKRRKES